MIHNIDCKEKILSKIWAVYLLKALALTFDNASNELAALNTR